MKKRDTKIQRTSSGFGVIKTDRSISKASTLRRKAISQPKPVRHGELKAA